MRKSRIIKDLKTILGYRGGGGAAVLQLSREDKICAIFILQGFLMEVGVFYLLGHEHKAWVTKAFFKTFTKMESFCPILMAA